MNDPTATSDLKLKRLNAALEHTGAVRGVRNKHVAEATGYKEGSVRGILSGNAVLSDRFIKAVCIEFNIRRRWIEEGEEPMLAQQGEAPYPSDSVNGIINSLKNINLDRHQTGIGAMLEKVFSGDVSNSDIPAIAGVGAQRIAGSSNAPRIAGPAIAGFNLEENNSQNLAPAIAGRHYTIAGDLAGNKVSLDDIVEIIKLYFIDSGKEKSLGFFAAMAFLSVISLPDHEMIDLVYQLRKLKDGDSDKLATAAADERFERSGIKPTTRLKLERIPVVDDDEKQEK